MPARQCPFCGKSVSNVHRQCPYCRETLPEAPKIHAARPQWSNAQAQRKMRQGLLYMLMAGLIYYFVDGYGSPLQLPVAFQPIVSRFLTPLLFLAGLGLTLYGFYMKKNHA
jgi:predicted nucleic acid-binding Zn ribbon protein